MPSRLPSRVTDSARAVSPVIGVVLLVAVTVVLAGTVVAFFLGADSGLRQPAPQVAQASADLDRQGSGVSGGTVTVTHQGGDPVTVADIRVVVDTSDVADCSVDQAVIENLPATRVSKVLGYADENLANDDDSPISNGRSDAQWSAGALHTNTGKTFAVGDSFQFRLKSSNCGLLTGETIRVTVVHEPSQQSIIEVTATAR